MEMSDLVATWQRLRSVPGNYVLCGQLTYERILYRPGPEDRLRLGEPEGKERFLVYALCRAHERDAATFELCEQVLIGVGGEGQLRDRGSDVAQVFRL